MTEHVEGQTEAWVQQLVCSLLSALQRDHPTVLECGGFMGHTSAKLAETLQRLGGGDLTVAEYDPDAPERADAVQAALERTPCGNVTWRVRREDAISVIKSFPDESISYAFLDDDHSKEHVNEEIHNLLPKMQIGGIITGHDVFGSCDLQEVFAKYGGYSLELPRLGPAGGLGVLQIR